MHSAKATRPASAYAASRTDAVHCMNKTMVNITQSRIVPIFSGSKLRALSLSTKLSAAYTVIVILVAGSLALTLYVQLRQAQRQVIRERLHDVVGLAASQIDGDFHTLIVAPEDAGSSYYRIIQETLHQIQKTSSAIKHIYTLRQQEDGSIVVVVDHSTPSETPATIGQQLTSRTPLLNAGLTTIQEAMVEEEFVRDASGDVLLYGYAPILDQSGRQDGVLVIELDAAMVVESEARARNIALIAFFFTLPLIVLLGIWLVRRVTSPVGELLRGAEWLTQGQLDYRVQVHSRDELGTLAAAFNTMATSLQARIAAEHQAQQELNVSNQQLKEHSLSLEEAMQEQQRLSETVRKMSLPVLPIAEGIVVMPLVGTIDSNHARELSETLLHGVEQHRARVALIDLTGVALVDTFVTQTLVEAILATRLLGAQALVVGIRPELAQMLLEIGVDLSNIETSATLQSGLLRALHLTGRRVMSSQ